MVGERLYRDLGAWDEVGYGLDFAPAKAMSLNNIYVRWLEPADLLDGGAAAKAWDQVRFDRKNKTTRTGEVEWKVKRAGTIYGLALWWIADWPRVCACRPARSTRARTGSSCICRPWSRSPSRPARRCARA